MSPVAQLRGMIGVRRGPSSWLTVDQERIDAFTRATDDPQWIHLDPVRAATGPFGATIAQGYLTMSLMVPMLSEIGLPVDPPPRLAVNYGLNRLRFPAPVIVGSRIRAFYEILSVEEFAGDVQLVRRVTVEREEGERPVLVAETVTRLVW